MINWKSLLVIPHTSGSLCAKAGDIKSEEKSLVFFLPFRLLRSQQMNRSTEGCCLCLLCNTGCLLWKCKREDEGGWKGRGRAGCKRKKKKKKKEQGIPSIPALSPPGLQGNSTQSSEMEPSKSLAELIQSVQSQNSQALFCSVEAYREPVLVTGEPTRWLSPARLSCSDLFYPVEAGNLSFLPLHTQRDWLLTAASL